MGSQPAIRLYAFLKTVSVFCAASSVGSAGGPADDSTSQADDSRGECQHIRAPLTEAQRQRLRDTIGGSWKWSQVLTRKRSLMRHH
jgi:hypothetical protein